MRVCRFRSTCTDRTVETGRGGAGRGRQGCGWAIQMESRVTILVCVLWGSSFRFRSFRLRVFGGEMRDKSREQVELCSKTLVDGIEGALAGLIC